MVLELLYYLPLFVGLAFFVLGREYQDAFFGLASGVVFLVYGVGIMISPLPVLDSLTDLAVAMVCWGAGLYILIRGGVELAKG